MATQSTEPLLRHILYVLEMKGAHIDFDDALSDFPPEQRGAKPAGAPHSAWELLEHMRIAQADILDFSRNPKYREKIWPENYWPASPEPPSEEAWDGSLREFRRDLKQMRQLVEDARSDLFARIPHGNGQTLLREALLVADHNSYHLGQLVFLKKMLAI